MSKLKLLIPFALLSVSLFANEAYEKEIAICEDKYVVCSEKCEENDKKDPQECITECEKTYYECDADISEKYKEKSVD